MPRGVPLTKWTIIFERASEDWGMNKEILKDEKERETYWNRTDNVSVKEERFINGESILK